MKLLRYTEEMVIMMLHMITTFLQLITGKRMKTTKVFQEATNLGILELDFNKYSEAEECFNKSIELKEEHNLSKDSMRDLENKNLF